MPDLKSMKLGLCLYEEKVEFYTRKQKVKSYYILVNVSENVRNATNLAPCIVDYAVNFGIRNMETQWRKNLLENDNKSPFFFYFDKAYLL